MIRILPLQIIEIFCGHCKQNRTQQKAIGGGGGGVSQSWQEAGATGLGRIQNAPYPEKQAHHQCPVAELVVRVLLLGWKAIPTVFRLHVPLLKIQIQGGSIHLALFRQCVPHYSSPISYHTYRKAESLVTEYSEMEKIHQKGIWVLLGKGKQMLHSQYTIMFKYTW